MHHAVASSKKRKAPSAMSAPARRHRGSESDGSIIDRLGSDSDCKNSSASASDSSSSDEEYHAPTSDSEGEEVDDDDSDAEEEDWMATTTAT